MIEFRMAQFRKMRAEWEEKLRGVPPGERWVCSRVLQLGYQIARWEPDPEKQKAFRDWMDWPSRDS
ncbi:MAG: hypothetical protein WAN43_01255 [Rhodomicrobium sp.]